MNKPIFPPSHPQCTEDIYQCYHKLTPRPPINIPNFHTLYTYAELCGVREQIRLEVQTRHISFLGTHPLVASIFEKKTEKDLQPNTAQQIFPTLSFDVHTKKHAHIRTQYVCSYT